MHCCFFLDTYEMITEYSEGGYQFVVSYHFESNMRAAGERSHPSRVKRLAQEAVTLSTSLPLSYSSSVFVRCDTDRLDIMKVRHLLFVTIITASLTLKIQGHRNLKCYSWAGGNTSVWRSGIGIDKRMLVLGAACLYLADHAGFVFVHFCLFHSTMKSFHL